MRLVLAWGDMLYKESFAGVDDEVNRGLRRSRGRLDLPSARLDQPPGAAVVAAGPVAGLVPGLFQTVAGGDVPVLQLGGDPVSRLAPDLVVGLPRGGGPSRSLGAVPRNPPTSASRNPPQPAPRLGRAKKIAREQKRGAPVAANASLPPSSIFPPPPSPSSLPPPLSPFSSANLPLAVGGTPSESAASAYYDCQEDYIGMDGGAATTETAYLVPRTLGAREAFEEDAGGYMVASSVSALPPPAVEGVAQEENVYEDLVRYLFFSKSCLRFVLKSCLK